MKLLAKEILHSSYSKIDDRPIHLWAKENINLPSSYFVDAGFIDLNKSPYLIDVLHAFKDFNTHTIVFIASPKLGKSMLGDIMLIWAVLNRPSTFQWYNKTNEQANIEMKNHLIPLIKNCDCLKGFAPTDDRDYTKNLIQFSTMNFNINGAAESTTQQRDSCYCLVDESWEFDDKTLEHARNRTLSFRESGHSKFILITQGGKAGTTLDTFYNQGDMSVYSIPCIKCNQYIQPELEHFKFKTTKDKKKSYQWKEIFESIVYECPHCKYQMKEKEVKSYWNKNAKYIPTNTNYINGVRSFRVPAVSSTKYSWEFIIEKWLRAKEHFNMEGNPEKMRDFFQQIMAENVDDDKLYDQRDSMKFYDYTISSNNNGVAKFCIIDVQQSEEYTPYYWVLVIEFDAIGNAFVLWFGKITTEQDLKELIKKHDIPHNRVFCDIGFNMGQTALWVSKNKWFGVKGDGNRFSRYFTWGNPPVKKLHSDMQYYATGQQENGKQFICQYFALDVNGLKDILDKIRKGQSQLKLHVPEGNGVFAEQMDSEYWHLVPRGGRQIKEWICKKNRDNHAWDCMTYAIAIAIVYEHKIQLLNNFYPSGIGMLSSEEVETITTGSI